MTIITPGDKTVLTKDRTFECPVCGCKFTASYTEYKAQQSVTAVTFYCKCPTCSFSALESTEEAEEDNNE